MNDYPIHVISKLKWDTRLDQKERANELQCRLSDWSGATIKKLITTVFDELCPSEQTWKIKSLELDLGAINFDHLEFELSAKFTEQLNDKLTELILYAYKRSQDVEILNEKRSYILLLRYYLSNGMMPWNYQSADGSVNQILSVQLQYNKDELMEMLRESGFGAEQVRKRMAWQFNEPNMIKIIEGLEPNVGGQIILFSNELTKVQQKETIVQSGSTKDFKKNLWFWVLNYLLTERGTVFNRVQFMKSNIMQMAAHYNMQYDQLFELIELSVEKLKRSLSLQPDFITTLLLLSNENKRRKKNVRSVAQDQQDHWKLMETLFLNQSLRRHAGNTAVLNELVVSLSTAHKDRFLVFINSLGSRADFWLPLVNDLADDTLKTVFSSLKGSPPLTLTASILFLNQLIGGVQPNTERNVLWYNGLMFLQQHKHTSFSQDQFIDTLVTALSVHKKLSKLELLDQLMGAKLPHALKTIFHTEIYRALTTAFSLEISVTPERIVKKQLQELMKTYGKQLFNGLPDQQLLEAMHDQLSNYFHLYPTLVMKTYQNSSYQTSLQQLLPELMTGKYEPALNVAEQQVLPADTVNALLAVIRQGVLTASQLNMWAKFLKFSELISVITPLQLGRKSWFKSLNQFYIALGNITVTGIPAKEIQDILFKKVMVAWASGNWKLLAEESIWRELIWEVCKRKTVQKAVFMRQMEEGKLRFPPVLRLALEALSREYNAAENHSEKESSKIQRQIIPNPVTGPSNERLKGGIIVKNAGIVLLNSYVTVLFSRLGLIDEHRKFINTEKQHAAVHYLQYVVTGLEMTEEFLLPLNKLLCGIPLAQPVKESTDISMADKELMNGLINAMIAHWPAIGKCSVDGLRGNWLVRDGLLTEGEDKWELVVEKRAYDLLINKSPYSFSVIRFPWMSKPLHVNWPY